MNQTAGERRPSPITSATSATVDTRNDIFPHRVMVFFKGWLGIPKLDLHHHLLDRERPRTRTRIFGNLGYQFSRKFSLYGGLNGLPGTRSLQGSHPYWLGHDRVMADEFFRPYFTYGVWAQGEVAARALVQRP